MRWVDTIAMGGLEATRAIHSLAGCKSRPILALIANAFDEDRLACKAAGIDDFIVKPMNIDALYATLLKWLDLAAADVTPGGHDCKRNLSRPALNTSSLTVASGLLNRRHRGTPERTRLSCTTRDKARASAPPRTAPPRTRRGRSSAGSWRC